MIVTAVIQLNEHKFEEKVFIPDCDIKEYEGNPDAMKDFVSDCIYNHISDNIRYYCKKED